MGLQDSCVWCSRRLEEFRGERTRVEASLRQFTGRSGHLQAAAPDASTQDLRIRTLEPLEQTCGRLCHNSTLLESSAATVLARTAETIPLLNDAGTRLEEADRLIRASLLAEQRAHSSIDAALRIARDADGLAAQCMQLLSTIR